MRSQGSPRVLPSYYWNEPTWKLPPQDLLIDGPDVYPAESEFSVFIMTTRRCLQGGPGVARGDLGEDRLLLTCAEPSCASDRGAPPGRCMGLGLLAKIKAPFPPGCHSPHAREQGLPGGLEMAVTPTRPLCWLHPVQAPGRGGHTEREGPAGGSPHAEADPRPLASSAMEHPAGIRDTTWVGREGPTVPAQDPRARQAL